MCITFHFYLERFIDHSITTVEKRSHRFEGEWGGVYRKVWRNEREGRDVVIKPWSQK